MPIGAVYQGHWRALEREWLRVFLRESASGPVAVTVSGSAALSRLISLVEGPVAGSSFYPGIVHLARSTAVLPAAPPVSVPQSIALASFCGCTPESAPAAGRFFERLIEAGIGAEAFQTVTQSVRGLHREVVLTAQRYQRYSEKREGEFPGTPDSIQALGPENAGRFPKYIFYGFYDLNPGQREFIRKLSQVSHILWFSPVHQSHRWRKTFSRTLDFLQDTGARQFHRIDAHIPLSPAAQLAENMLSGAVHGKAHGVSLKYCTGGSGFSRAVAAEVSSLLETGADPSWIAVVASGEDSRKIAAALHCEGLPCSCPLETPASRTAHGRLVQLLLLLPARDFHHTDIEKMLSTGAIEDGPDGHKYFLKAAETGARFGTEGLLKTGFAFAGTVAEYYGNLPLSDSPAGYLKGLMNAIEGLCKTGVPPWLPVDVLDSRLFRGSIPIEFSVFRQMVLAALEQPVRMAEPASNGVRVVAMEQTRGAVFPHIILTGMEEGTFPARTVLDPRLPPGVRELLQMPSQENREHEDAFLLRQVFEAADKSLCMICRNIDSRGNVIPVSPFIASLAASDSSVEGQYLPRGPKAALDIPASAPFLDSSLAAHTERLSFDPANPSNGAAHSGMIGPGEYRGEVITASMLEAYASDPFRFLCERVWKLKTPRPFPVCSEPEPASRGKIVHRSVELVLSSKADTVEAVETASRFYDLPALVGSETLANIWKQHTAAGIQRLLTEIEGRGLLFHSAEVSLSGRVAGLPASGRIDLIFKDRNGGFILADLKTGKPFPVTEKAVLNNRFQLPFYAALAGDNHISPISGACYIFLQGDGSLTFKEVDDRFLESIAGKFEDRVRELAEMIDRGIFPFSDSKRGSTR